MPPTLDEVLFLRGRPPLAEYIAFVAQNDVAGPTLNPGVLAAEWREANARIRELETTEAGIADSPRISDLPPELLEPAQALANEPSIIRSFSVVPFTIGMINLDDLVVFQKLINLTFVRQLAPQVSSIQSKTDLFKFVFSREESRPEFKMAHVGPNAIAFSSPSMDFRPLDTPVLSPQQLQSYEVGGTVDAVFGVALGYGANVLQVTRYKGRLILGNGSHRAYALREAGIQQVPCLIQNATLDDEVKMVFPGIAKDLDPYFTAVRPPMLKDYFEPQLTRTVHTPRKQRQVRVVFQVEQSDIPG